MCNKFVLAIVFIIMCSTNIFAQTGAISGRLQDIKGNKLAFANAALMKAADSTLVYGRITDSTGRFSITTPTPGLYFLRFSSIGFAENSTPVFEVTAPEFSKDFGTFTLKADAKTLKDVDVLALRPTITQMADRMVVTVEGTAMAAGNTAFAVLARAPGVFIDQDGNIQLNGRGGVTVMIDGKLTYLSARDLRTMLEGMAAENIKNIEIITNPSAKYDAEGTSGILNINLRKNTRQGMNGSVYGGYTYNFKQHGFTAGGNINYKNGRWNSFLFLDMARRVGGREATFTRVFYSPTKTTYFDQVATGNFLGYGPPAVRAGTDYSITDRHSVGFMVNYTTNKSTSDFLTDTYIGNEKGRSSQFIDANNYSSNRYRNFTTNVHYTGKLDTVGTTLSTDLDYVKITNRGESDFLNYFTNLETGEKQQDILYTNTPNGYDIYSGKIDFSRPFKKGFKLEMGAKASRVVSDNDFRFYFNNNGLVIDQQRTNHFNYRENIYAGYSSFSGNFSKQVSFQAGLRAEQTVSLGNSYTTGDVTKRKYLDFFPSLFIQQKVNTNYGINYSYGRRLTRPNYGNLNPFLFYRDPYTYIQGNPYLRPQYTHAFSVTQTFKKTYSLIVSAQLTKDVISELPMLDVARTTTIYYTGNVNNARSIGITGIAPIKISKKWETQNTVVLSHSKFNMTDNSGDLVNQQLFFMVQSNHTILLPMKFRMELNFLYRGPAASGLYHIASQTRVDAAFKRSLLNKKMDLSVNVTDIFKGQRLLFTTDIAGNINEFNQYFRTRALSLTLRYNFSKGQNVDVKRRNNNVEEVNRAN